MPFRMAGARDCAASQKSVRRHGFVPVSKIMASVGHLKKIWKDACRIAGAVHETHQVEVAGVRAGDFRKGLHFGAGIPQFCKKSFGVKGVKLPL